MSVFLTLMRLRLKKLTYLKGDNMSKEKWVPVGNRMMDRAYLRDGSVFHTGEALLLALLVHTKGKTKRGAEEMNHIAKIMNDPNLDKRKTSRKR